MNVAIVSKPEHAKSKAQALERMGHNVEVIDPRVGLPDRFDVFVFRSESLSESARREAADLKARGKHVLFANSLTEIRTAIEAIEVETQMSTPASIEETLARAINALGIYHPRVPFDGNVIYGLNRMGLVKNISLAQKAYEAAREINVNSVPRPFARSAMGKPRYTYYRWANRTRTVYEFVAASELTDAQLDEIGKLIGMSVNPNAHRAEADRRPAEGRATSMMEAFDRAEKQQTSNLPPEVDEDIEPEVEVAPVEETVEPEPLVVKSEVVEVVKEEPMPVLKLVEPEPVAPVEAAPVAATVEAKPRSVKADAKELVAMLIECLEGKTLDISIQLRPGQDPKIAIKQVITIVKESNDFDHLVE